MAEKLTLLFCVQALAWLEFNITKNPALAGLGNLIGGELGIRTPGGFNTSTVFKTAAIDRSANSPGQR